MRLKDKVAFVTGGGSGIGKYTIMRSVEEGAKVDVCNINEKAAKAVPSNVRLMG